MTSSLAELVRQTVAAWDADPAPDIVEPGVVHAKLGLADPDFEQRRTKAPWQTLSAM
jgi:hypothetical protein